MPEHATVAYHLQLVLCEEVMLAYPAVLQTTSGCNIVSILLELKQRKSRDKSHCFQVCRTASVGCGSSSRMEIHAGESSQQGLSYDRGPLLLEIMLE